MKDAFSIDVWVLLLLGLSFVASVALTGAMRALALSTNMIDLPNERGSHKTPTPRGGGIAIVVSFLAAIASLHVLRRLPSRETWLWLGSGGLVALIGLIDDRWQLRASTRLVGHITAVAWVLWLLGSMPPLTMLGQPVDLAWAGPPLAVFYMVWAVNFFNFMDGIDGIAALSTMTIAFGGALLNHWVLGGTSWIVPVLLGLTAGGFLVWNWPPARIFMGDSGSGFLGLAVGALTIGYGFQAPVLFWCWFILQGCFMVDATTTLVRRVRRGERPQQPHRVHAYQYASRRVRGHLPVTLAYAGVTLLWLFPIAALVALGRLEGVWALIIAYLPLVALAYHFKAGARELQDH
jgi:Fuc2NAc and GlcNAc transferase